MGKFKLTTSQLAVSIATATAISKVLGFVRELFIANYYGTSYVTDAYSMGISIPNTVLAGVIGAIATAYIPVFSQKMVEQGEEEANKFTSQLINIQSLGAMIVCFIGLLFSNQIVAIFAPGYTGETAALTAFYVRIAFIMAILNSIKDTLRSYLEYKGSFLLNVVMGYFQNFFIIAMVILSAMISNPKLIIIGTLLGSIVYFVSHIVLAVKKGFKYSFSFSFGDDTKEVLRLAIPVFLAGSLGQINAFVDKYLASGLPEGSVSALNYGNNLVSVISTFTCGIIMTILYPRMAKSFAENDVKRVNDLSSRTINVLFVITMPFTVGAMAYSSEIVQVIYERGSFNPESTKLVATAFMYYVSAMIFTAVKSCIDRMFNSLHNTKTSAFISVLSICVNISLNLILVKSMGHAGLALATSISVAFSTVVSYIAFRKKYSDYTLITDWKKLFQVCFFTVVSVGLSKLFYVFIGNLIWLPRMILLGLSVCVAVILYFLFLIVFKFDELSIIESIFKRSSKNDSK